MKLKPWTTKEHQYLKDNHKTMTDEELSNKLDRSIKAIALQRHSLGLRRYAIYEVRSGRKVLATGTAEECAKQLDIDTKTVYYYAGAKRLRKKQKMENTVIAERIF